MRLFPRTLDGILSSFTKTQRQLEEYIADRSRAIVNNDALVESHRAGIEVLQGANEALAADMYDANEVLQNIKAIVAPTRTTTEV